MHCFITIDDFKINGLAKGTFQLTSVRLVINLASVITYNLFAAYQITASRATSEKASLSKVMASRWFGVAAYMCLRLSEFLNPFFYNLASRSVLPLR